MSEISCKNALNQRYQMDDSLKTHQALVAVDEMLTKALGISEVSQIAMLEVADRRFMMIAWSRRINKFSKLAASKLKRRATVKQILSLANSIFSSWSIEVESQHFKTIEKAYKLAKKAAHKKIKRNLKGSLQYDTESTRELVKKARKYSVDPTFELVDEDAVEALQEKELFWMGEHYKNVTEPIKEKALEVIETGRRATAPVIEKALSAACTKVVIPGKFAGTQNQYLEGVVANAVTSARVHGQIRSFQELNISQYVIVNPLDERTCPVCGHLDGKIFTIEHGLSVLEAELASMTPEELKEAHPWYSEKQLKEISSRPGPVGKADADALATAGFSMPPFHFRCRCTVDVL